MIENRQVNFEQPGRWDVIWKQYKQKLDVGLRLMAAIKFNIDIGVYLLKPGFAV
ncbi:MAG: hypothetical protein ACYSWZ_13295 [Planctomycetota bacterium]|jgi:hypothetical protein